MTGNRITFENNNLPALEGVEAKDTLKAIKAHAQSVTGQKVKENRVRVTEGRLIMKDGTSIEWKCEA